MEKKLITTRPFTESKGKAKLCIMCDSVAAYEMLFELDSIIIAERYCDLHVKEIQ
jgi:hypothetical protein